MRALPIGWVLPHDQAERRRQVTIAMSRATQLTTGQVRAELPWHRLVVLSEPETAIAETAAALATARAIQSV